MIIAFVTNQYPATSHTFIRREIQGLERQGVEVLRFAHRRSPHELVHAQDHEEATRTRYLLEAGVFSLAWGMIASLFRSPTLFCRVAFRVFATWKRHRRLVPHLAYLAQACRLLRCLKQESAAHLHAHFGTSAAMVALMCRDLGGPPFSFTVHGPEEFESPRRFALREKMSAASFVATISACNAERLRALCGGRSACPIHIIRCGVDDEFLLAPPTPVPDVQRMVCVARFEPRKGHDVLLSAVERLAERGLRLELLLIGDGPSRHAIEQRARAVSNLISIHFLGWQDGIAVREAIMAARLLVLASRSEGLPVAIMEAMALGRPVVASSVDGIPELVIDGETGWLVPPDDPGALAEAISAGMNCPVARLSQMGACARQAIEERHDSNRNAASLARLIAGTG